MRRQETYGLRTPLALLPAAAPIDPACEDLMGQLLEARSMTKLFGVVIGVNDVTLDLDPGVIGLLGPNGAGKSTFIKLITGQLRPSEGSVAVFGERPWNTLGRGVSRSVAAPLARAGPRIAPNR